ncbi:MAG: hypothetical protein LUC93_03070 [Planctomycetaceae bacterium]|nr:hypothetical protein [Planctomycetaceae bacterium]
MTTGNYFHGVTVDQIPTSLLTPKKSLSALPVILGCAPIHRLSATDEAKVRPGRIEIVHDLKEAGIVFGIDTAVDSFDHWTLSEAAYIYFQLMNVSPMVFINLFDPEKHRRTVTGERVVFEAGKAKLAHADVIGGAVLKPSDGGDPFQSGTDYHLNAVTGEITILDDGALVTVAEVVASYAYAAPEMVTSTDCIGGYNIATGATTGVSLVDDVFPKYREIPAIGLAPKFGEDPAVAMVLKAKMSLINGVFRGGLTVVDLPADGSGAVTRYSDAPSHKQRNGLVSEDMDVCWPRAAGSDKVLRLSTLAAARMAATDAENRGIPFVSPSNKALPITGCVANGEEVWLDHQKVTFLDRNGIMTITNFSDGWKLWGNHTAAYPDNRDPKDYFIPARRMMAWYGNRLITTWWSKVDAPLTRRLVETMVNTEQCYLNSLVAGEVLNGGRIELPKAENNILDLMDGVVRFHCWLGIIPPAKHINFVLEYDPTYLSTLFASIAA